MLPSCIACCARQRWSLFQRRPLEGEKLSRRRSRRAAKGGTARAGVAQLVAPPLCLSYLLALLTSTLGPRHASLLHPAHSRHVAMLARTAFAAATLVVAASAQSTGSLIDGLSATCQSAALSLLTGNSDLGNCAAIGSLSSIVLTSGSVVDPVRLHRPLRAPSTRRLRFASRRLRPR